MDLPSAVSSASDDSSAAHESSVDETPGALNMAVQRRLPKVMVPVLSSSNT